MALRDQPYLPLYIQDFLTDEKLAECSAAAHGVYIRIMCMMHKSDEYGTIELKNKDKKSENNVENFAKKLEKLTPFPYEIILESLQELKHEKVLFFKGDKMSQKRMVKDSELSTKRQRAVKNKNFVGTKPLTKPSTNAPTNTSTNAENESEYEDESVMGNTKGGMGEIPHNITPPTTNPNRPAYAPQFSEVVEYFIHQGKTESMAKEFFNYYEGLGWKKGQTEIAKWRFFANIAIGNWNWNKPKTDAPKQTLKTADELLAERKARKQ